MRYILPASHVVKIKPTISNAIERNNCHQGTNSGTPFAIRPIITIGDVNGIMLPQNAIGLSGFSY